MSLKTRNVNQYDINTWSSIIIIEEALFFAKWPKLICNCQNQKLWTHTRLTG
jgi:hypothetical protein